MGVNRSFLKSFIYAFVGLKVALKEEPNFKIHILVGIAAMILAYFLGFSTLEWFVLIFTILFVLILEIMNTAIEDLVDLVTPGPNMKAKKIKDVMAAAVLLSAILAALVGVFLFLPKIVVFF